MSWLSELSKVPNFFEIFPYCPDRAKAPSLIFSGISNKKRFGTALKISNLELHEFIINKLVY